MARKILAVVLAMAVVLSLFAIPASASADATTTIKLSSTAATMGVGEKLRFVATTNSSKPITWASRDTSVATVSKTGVVTALKVGETTIRARVDGVNAFLALTVKKAPTAVGLNDLEVFVGQTKKLTVLLTKDSASRTRKFESSDKSVATVDKNGNVTGVKTGTAKITVTTYNGLSASATVTVPDSRVKGGGPGYIGGSAGVASGGGTADGPKGVYEELSATTYQSIYDDYSQRIKNATPIIVREFNNEAKAIKDDGDALAELSINKIKKLGDILGEGTVKMSELRTSGVGTDSEYEQWRKKLIDVFIIESRKIPSVFIDVN